MSAMHYELWSDSDGCGHTFIPHDHQQKDFLTHGKSLVWSCDAETWEEACTKKNEFLGFAPYQPMVDDAPSSG